MCMRFRGMICFLLGLLLLDTSLAFSSNTPNRGLALTITSTKYNGLATAQTEIFDGLYANYTFEFLGSTNKSVLSYTHVSGEYYNVSWTLQGSGRHSWIESIQTRVTSNSS